MKIFQWNDLLNNNFHTPYFAKGCGISIGSFDGLHKGHGLLLSSLVQSCTSENLLKGVFTFPRPLPSIKYSDEYLGDISTLNQRLHFFEELGIDFVIIADFDKEFAQKKGIDFIKSLCTICNLKLLAEGVDFKCGFKGATDVQAIKYFAEHSGLKTIFVDPVYYKNGNDIERISSSYIRQKIKYGFLSTVEEMLSRPYELDLSDFNQTIIEKKNIIQVLPPENVYFCNKKDKEVRVEITENQILISDYCDRLYF